MQIFFKRKVRTNCRSLIITLPTEINELLNITNKDYLTITVNDNGEIVMKKVEE